MKDIDNKISSFVKHFGFTKDDVKNQIDFVCEAEYLFKESNYASYCALYDAIKIEYGINTKAKINQLVKDYLIKNNS